MKKGGENMILTISLEFSLFSACQLDVIIC
jgi:hypothetical protein